MRGSQLHVALVAAWLLTRYWWMSRRGASPAALAARTQDGSWRVVLPRLPSSRVLAIVSRVARVHPLQPACLPQALTGCHLLSSAGRAALVRLGVDREGGQLAAHAWVQTTGMPQKQNAGRFATLGDIQPDGPLR
jgi:hypothetical protein